MRVVVWLVATLLTLAVAGCSTSTPSGSGSTSAAASSTTAGSTMPDVTGKNLDEAEVAIETAGGDPERVKVIGGGALGIVVKSNWYVCAQSPAAGAALPDSPELTVERSCAAASSGAASPTAPSGTPTSSQPMTAASNADFAAVLQVTDDCASSVGAFASQYAGQDVEFDGSVRALNLHGSATTRYDILIAPGDAGPNATTGPNFQYQDVNLTTDLNFEGTVPDSVNAGTRLHLVAAVGAYDAASCLLQLKPVSTQVR